MDSTLLANMEEIVDVMETTQGTGAELQIEIF